MASIEQEENVKGSDSHWISTVVDIWKYDDFTKYDIVDTSRFLS